MIKTSTSVPTNLNGNQVAADTQALPDAKSQSQPEIIAILCANDEFKVWLAQGSATFLAGTGRPNSEIYRDQQPLPKGAPPPGGGRADSANAPEARSWAGDAGRPILSRN